MNFGSPVLGVLDLEHPNHHEEEEDGERETNSVDSLVPRGQAAFQTHILSTEPLGAREVCLDAPGEEKTGKNRPESQK